MKIILATISVEGWQAATALLTLIFVWALKFWQEFLKDRRDRINDEAQLRVLSDIAASNAKIRDGQIEQNGKLATVVKVNDAYHAEIVRNLQSNCKFNPQTKKENQ